MIDYLKTLTTTVLDPISIWIGLVVTIPIFWTWWDIVIGRRRRHRNWLQTAIATTGNLPIVMIVDTRGDIRSAVLKYVGQCEQLNNVKKTDIVEVSRPGHIKAGDMASIAAELQTAISEALRHAPSEIHLFMACPLSIAAMVGAELSNVSCKVILYQTSPGSSDYVNFGPLKHPRF